MSVDQRYIKRLKQLFGKDFTTDDGELEANFKAYFQEKTEITPDPFPYHLLVTNWWGDEQFRFMVDEQGDDANDGLSWNTPKKTITGVLNLFPVDLQGYNIEILVHSGEYAESYQAIHNNGAIIINWVGTHINKTGGGGIDGDWSKFVRHDVDNPIRDNDQAIIKATTPLLYFSRSKTLSVRHDARNSDFAWSAVGYGFWNKLVFTHADSFTEANSFSHLIAFDGVNFVSEVGWGVKLGVCQNGFRLWGNGIVSGWMRGMRVEGGIGGASVSTSGWAGCWLFETNTPSVFVFDSWQMKYAVGFEAPTHPDGGLTGWEVVNVKHLFNSTPIYKVPGITIKTNKILVDNSGLSGSPTVTQILNQIGLGWDIEYDASEIEYLHTTSFATTVKETDADVTKVYLDATVYLEDGKMNGVAVYRAIVSQTGTNAPVSDYILENTLGGVPTWARSFSGIYTLTLIGSFPSADKVFMEISNQATNALVGTFTSAGVLIFNNFSDHNALSLGDEVKAYIEIRVYP